MEKFLVFFSSVLPFCSPFYVHSIFLFTRRDELIALHHIDFCFFRAECCYW